MRLIEILFNYTQPLVVLSFLIPGLLALLLQKWQIGITNVCIALANFMIFYGNYVFKNEVIK